MSLGDDPPILEGGFKKVDKDQWIILHYSPFKVKYDKTTKLFLALYDINYICIKIKCKSIFTSFANAFGNTVATHNKNFSYKKHTLFVLTKMCLFGEEEDFGKTNSPSLPKMSTFSPNKHFSHNKHTFFGLTKMCLL